MASFGALPDPVLNFPTATLSFRPLTSSSRLSQVAVRKGDT
jgi:hypothetical protein